ncbi:degenerin deg-1-like [Lytechinus variegatus]|uniref:degenerin deg-1-like n=1 Tax=Lytechinus variegatus TaxID=7654 RepID=UPI001BB20DB6|nr:degenerin deg-1-like [Lytechinus variegatus]
MKMVKRNSSFRMGGTKDLADLESVNAVLLNYSDVTTAHGIPRIITSKSMTSRFFWSFATLVALAAFLWQGSLLLHDFRGHPYTTQIDVVTRTELQFPAVTVCNMNKMRRSALVNTRFESLILADGGATGGDADYSWWFEWSSEWYRKYEEEESQGQEEGEVKAEGELENGEEERELGSAIVTETVTLEDSFNIAELTNTTYIPNESHETVKPSQDHLTDEETTLEPSFVETEIPSFFEPESSGTEPEGQPMKRRRRSSLRLIPDPVTGELSQRPTVRQKRETEDTSMENFNERYDWWEDDWEDEDFDYQEYEWKDVANDNDWEGFYRQSTADDFSDLLEVINPSKEELKLLGHQAEDFILQCTFDRRQCNYTDFRQFQNKYYGNCFTFNQVVGNSSGARSTGKTGAQYGLHLTLFTEQPEYVGLFAQEAGVRVAVHPSNVFPFPEDDGVVASTGQVTDIGLRQSYFQRLPDPHGNCTDGTKTNFTSTEYAYTTRACIKSCIQQHLLGRCDCVTDILMNDTLCSSRNRSQQVCRQAIEQFFHEGELPCNCPVACRETLFVTAVTSSLWPSERYESHLKTRLTNEKAKRILENVEQTRKNLARVRIYFEELNYEQMIQNPKYTIESLLGGIGGLLGLYIGFSVITICEVGVLVVDLVKYLCRKAYSHDRVIPVDFKS